MRHLQHIGSRGQVLVEFAFVLPLFIALCAGAIALYRSMQYDWQAQQEARYLAFNMAANQSNASGDLLRNGTFDRPKYVERAAPVRIVRSNRSLSQLLSAPTSSADHRVRVRNTPPNIASPRERIAVRPGNQFDRSIDQVYRRVPTTMRSDYLALSRAYAKDPRIAAMKRARIYQDSAAALSRIDRAVGLITRTPITLNPAEHFRLEQAVAASLHESPSGGMGSFIGRTGFSLSNPIFSLNSMFPGVFEGVMTNVLADERDERRASIEQSVIITFVDYRTRGAEVRGLPGRRALVKGATGRFTLVHDPWDIKRRTLNSGSWRTLGEQTDSSRSSSEEGILRKRTLGLWLFPSDPVAMLRPGTALLPRFLSAPVNFLEGPSRSAINEMKKLVSDDNPLRKIFDLLNKLPIVSSLDLQLPEWPTVRPQSYPHSSEMDGDQLTGSRRSFQTYVDEQRNHK